MKLDFYEDPGHGWLAVPLELLDTLGRAPVILGPVATLVVQAAARLEHLDRGHGVHLRAECIPVLFPDLFPVPLTVRGTVGQVQLTGQAPGVQAVNECARMIRNSPRDQRVNVEIGNNKTAHDSILSGCPGREALPSATIITRGPGPAAN